MFRDRREAGVRLAEALAKYRDEDAVILALPRGGVVVGYEVAAALSAPLDILAVRKVGHPASPEFAIGAVDERGTTLLSEGFSEADEQWVAREVAKETKEAQRRARLYRGNLPPRSLKGKTVLLVDDGIATGLTMRLAARVAREQKPKRMVIAVPVASEEAVRDLEKEADEVIVLEPPAEFLGAVGAHYDVFEQVSDAEVIRLLKSTRSDS